MFYTQSVEDTLRELDCTADGLTVLQAKQRNAHYGKNSLPQAEKQPSYIYLLSNLKAQLSMFY